MNGFQFYVVDQFPSALGYRVLFEMTNSRMSNDILENVSCSCPPFEERSEMKRMSVLQTKKGRRSPPLFVLFVMT